MIDLTLQFLTHELNEHFNRVYGFNSENRIVLSSASSESGVAIPPSKVGVSLINIEEERVHKEQRTTFLNENGTYDHYNPEIKLNVFVLFSANFYDRESGSMDYLQGLKQLSEVIRFFQGKNVFSPDNSPNLDSSLRKLVVELYSFSFEQLYNFWSVVGIKYLPSVLYKVRLLSYQQERTISPSHEVTALDLQVNTINQ